MTDIQEFNTAAHAAEEWINQLAQRLGWRNREKVYSALVATLHALRDSLPAHEAVFLGDHLTVLLRGLYYEGWRLAKYSSLKSRDFSWSAFAKACIAIRELTPSKSPAWFLLCSPSGCLQRNLKMCEP